MKNEKEGNAALAGIVIVVIILLALVVPYTLSLVDTDPRRPEGEGPHARMFHMAPGTTYTAWLSQRMNFDENVEVVSVLANLGIEGSQPGRCVVHAQLQVSNAVGGAASVSFASQVFEPLTWPDMQYFGATLDGEPKRLSAGTYYLAMAVECAESGQAVEWRWYFAYDDIDLDPTVTLLRHCSDFNDDGFWNPDSGLSCQPPVFSFILEGNVGWTTEPPPVANETTEPPPPLVDTTGEDEDYDWLMYAILGGVIIIVLVVILVAVRW